MTAGGYNAEFQRKIAATDRQIDRLVYELYGLTEEEIRIVEGGAETKWQIASKDFADEHCQL